VAWGTEWLDLRRERDRDGGHLDKASKYYRGKWEEDDEEDALPTDVEQAVVKESPPAQVLSEASAYQMKLRRLRKLKRLRRLLEDYGLGIEEYGLGIQRLCST
jgi:hypothetical protein